MQKQKPAASQNYWGLALLEKQAIMSLTCLLMSWAWARLSRTRSAATTQVLPRHAMAATPPPLPAFWLSGRAANDSNLDCRHSAAC